MISQDLELTIETALGGIDQIDAALQQSATNFSVALTDALGVLGSAGDQQVQVAVDGTQITDEITSAVTAADNQTLDIPVNADIAPAESEIQGLSGEQIDVTVNADTSEAQTQMQDLGGSADTASGGLEKVKAAGDGIGVMGEMAGGSIAGLGGSMGALGPEGAAAGAGVGVVGGFIDKMFNSAVQGDGAAMRFSQTLGQLAGGFDKNPIDGMNMSLEQLGQHFGSTKAQMENSLSNMFQFGNAAGKTQQQTAGFSSQVEMLAARAVSLNPGLGSVSDASNKLELALARGGKFASAYGISLSTAEIKARALAETGKKSAGDLTIQDKAFAGASIAAERYGKESLPQIAKGMENPINKQKSFTVELDNMFEKLGKPLIAPMFEIMKSIVPVIGIVAKIFADLGKDFLPMVAKMLQDSMPAWQMLDSVFKAIEPIMPLITFALEMMFNPIGAITGAVQELGPVFSDVWNGIQSALSGIPDLIGNVLSFFMGMPGKILGFLMSLGGDLLNLFVSALQSAGQGVLTGITAVLNFFINLPGQILSFLGGLAGDLLNLWVNINTTVIGAVWGGISSVVSFFFGLPERVIGALAGLAGSLFNSAVNALSSMASGVGSGIGSVINFFVGLPDQILSAIGGLISQMFDAGGQIIDGLVNGIKDGAGKVLGAIGDLASQAWDAISSGFGIFSPSTMTHYAGSMLMEGMAAGISDNSSLVTDQLSTLVDKSTAQVAGLAAGGITAGANLAPVAVASVGPAPPIQVALPADATGNVTVIVVQSAEEVRAFLPPGTAPRVMPALTART